MNRRTPFDGLRKHKAGTEKVFADTLLGVKRNTKNKALCHQSAIITTLDILNIHTKIIELRGTFLRIKKLCDSIPNDFKPDACDNFNRIISRLETLQDIFNKLFKNKPVTIKGLMYDMNNDKYKTFALINDYIILYCELSKDVCSLYI